MLAETPKHPLHEILYPPVSCYQMLPVAKHLESIIGQTIVKRTQDKMKEIAKYYTNKIKKFKYLGFCEYWTPALTN